MYTINHLSKVYSHRSEPVYALRDISMSIRPGSFVAVTGPSGSGKTTLLLTLGGLIRPTSGTLQCGDLPLHSLSSRDLAHFRSKRVGFVLQTFNLVPYLSALDNVMLPLFLNGGNGASGKRRAMDLLVKMGLETRRDFLPRELSVGQQQRVAIARALANNPDIILADEPTGNLDPALSDEILTLLQTLNRQEQKTVVMVTHSPAAASKATETLSLNEGAIDKRNSG
jgi:putative ABC transport system ATP-binding protein